MGSSNEAVTTLIQRLRDAEKACADAAHERCAREGLSPAETEAFIRKIADDAVDAMNARLPPEG